MAKIDALGLIKAKLEIAWVLLEDAHTALLIAWVNEIYGVCLVAMQSADQLTHSEATSVASQRDRSLRRRRGRPGSVVRSCKFLRDHKLIFLRLLTIARPLIRRSYKHQRLCIRLQFALIKIFHVCVLFSPFVVIVARDRSLEFAFTTIESLLSKSISAMLLCCEIKKTRNKTENCLIDSLRRSCLRVIWMRNLFWNSQ